MLDIDIPYHIIQLNMQNFYYVMVGYNCRCHEYSRDGASFTLLKHEIRAHKHLADM